MCSTPQNALCTQQAFYFHQCYRSKSLAGMVQQQILFHICHYHSLCSPNL